MQSDPGRRISCKTLSLLGGSSLGVANSLGLADLIMAPGMFSLTACSGSVLLQISKSVNRVLCSLHAHDSLGVDLSWRTVVPSGCRSLHDLLRRATAPMHKDMNLELKRTLEPRVMSREELAKTGTVPRQEIIVAIGFMLASVGRASAFSQASTPTRSVSASLPSLRQAP